MSLPACCEESLVRGESAAVHALVCEHRPPPPPAEPETPTLFDIDPPEPERGGPQL